MNEDMKDQLTFAFYALESRYSSYGDSERYVTIYKSSYANLINHCPGVCS